MSSDFSTETSQQVIGDPCNTSSPKKMQQQNDDGSLFHHLEISDSDRTDLNSKFNKQIIMN